jgi:hypothetical protein
VDQTDGNDDAARFPRRVHDGVYRVESAVEWAVTGIAGASRFDQRDLARRSINAA